jgi:acid phosphatase class B
LELKLSQDRCQHQEKASPIAMKYKRSDYLRFSAQCVLISRRLASPEHRKFLLDMAESWRKLADSAPDAANSDDVNGTAVDED